MYTFFLVFAKMYTSACVYCTVMTLFWRDSNTVYTVGENIVLVKYLVGRCFVCVS